MLRVGLLHSVVRLEEKLLLRALEDHPDLAPVMIDERRLRFDPGPPPESTWSSTGA